MFMTRKRSKTSSGCEPGAMRFECIAAGNNRAIGESPSSIHSGTS